MQHARDQHLLIAGGGDNCVRLLPPLTLTLDEAREAVEKLERACEAARAKAKAAARTHHCPGEGRGPIRYSDLSSMNWAPAMAGASWS